MTFSLLIEQLMNGIGYGLMLFMLAAGLTLVLGVMNTLNLAHGSIYMIGGYVAASAGIASGSFIVAILSAAMAAVLVSIVLEFSVMRRLYRMDHLAQVVATFGVSLIIDDLCKAIWGVLPVQSLMPSAFQATVELVSGVPYPSYRLVIVVAGIVFAAVLYYLVNHTRLGMYVRAGASNRPMAELMGVRINIVFVSVFTLGSILAAVAAALMGPITTVEPGIGAEILIPALVIIVIGGIGSIRGAFVASLLVGLIDTGGRAFFVPLLKTFMSPSLATDVGPALASMSMYVLMAVVIAYKRTGFFSAGT